MRNRFECQMGVPSLRGLPSPTNAVTPTTDSHDRTRIAAGVRLCHPRFDGPHCSLSSILNVQLANDVLLVLFDGLDADPQRLADFGVAQSLRDMSQYLQLAIGQWV